jgi:dihydropteroate synthase
MRSWLLANSRRLPLDRPRLVAILNVTPDSFHDGGRFASTETALAAAALAVEEGAAMLDIGGESTRPGADRVNPAEQIRRVVPLVLAIRAQPGALGRTPISVDTTLADVARSALDAGADAVNDVSAGTEDPELLDVVAASGAGVILMHRLRPPGDDAYSDRYESPPIDGDVVSVVLRMFQDRALPAAREAGIADDRIVIDPGLGFGKTVPQNLELIRRTPELIGAFGLPVLSALSRKSFVGRVGLARDSDPAERLPATLALSLEHRRAGAGLFRVHDVAAHAQAFAASAALSPPAATRSPV